LEARSQWVSIFKVVKGKKTKKQKKLVSQKSYIHQNCPSEVEKLNPKLAEGEK